MGLTLAHPAHSHMRATNGRWCVRASVRVCTASRYHLAATHHWRRIEQRASNLLPRGVNTAPTVRRAKPHTCVVHEVLTGVCCLPSHCCVARACCALSASPSSASWHDCCRWAARQMLMRTASYDRCALHDTWHDEHNAVRRVPRARPAYAAFSAVSSAICARSSAMPAGSLSSVLGISTAPPTVRSCLSGKSMAEWEPAWTRVRAGARPQSEREP